MSSLSNANTASHPSPPEANPSQQAVEVTATSALSTSESHSQSQNTQTLVANESVADIALQESANPLVHKKPELSQFMQKGCYLDVHEYLGDWRAGIVVQVIEKHNSLQIQFDGCPSKMDEYVPMNSNRLAHFRKFTQGYTGEKYCAFRQKRTYADIEQMIAKCIQSDNVGFITLTACEYNQEARGRYFFGVDQALQNIAYDEHQDVPISVLKIILHHVSYAIRTIANLPNTFADYWKSVANPDLQFTHLPVAISRGTYEVLQLLLHILGSFDRLVSHPNCYYARCWNTIKDQRMNILAGVPAANRNIIHIPSTDLLEQSPEQQSDAQMQDENIGVVTRTVREQVKVKVRTEIIPIISSYFWGYGGYTAILSLFEGPTEDSPDSMIPLETLFQLAKIIHNGSRGMGSAYLSPLIEKLVDYTNRRFRSLSEREIKEYDSFLVSKVRERVQECAKLHPDEEISEHLLQEIDAMDLNVAVKLLSSQYLNKKIQGLNDISEIISDLRQNHNTMNFNGNSQQSEVRLRSNSLFINNRRVNAEVFAQWIIDAKILDSLLGDSMHVEIIRRCHEIIRFLCSFGRLPLQLIEVIWNSCGADKHEAIVSAIYEMIIQIADLLDLEALNYLHAKINSIPLHEINELTLMLIRGFAQKAIDRLVPFPDFNDEMVDEQDDSTTTNSFDWIASCKHEENFFCLDLLWRILLNNDESKSVTSPITTTSISTAAITATTTTTTPKSSTKQVIPNDNLMIPEIPNNNHLSTVIVDGALGIAKEILVSQQGAHVVKKYIWMCLEEIRAGRASYQMYALMNAMAEQEFRHPSLVFLLNRSNVDLLQILIDEIRSFLGGVVKRTMSASSTTTTVPNSESAAAAAAPTTTGAAAAAAVNKPQYLATLIQNTYSIEANLQVRLLWLETILLKTDNENNRIFCITPNHFDTLWEQFVQNANHLAETQYFLQWIHSKAYPSHKQMYAQNFLHVDIMQLFSFEVIRHIFSNILCNPLRINYKKLSPELFTIFLYFFKKINLKLKNIELVHGLNNKFKVINESLQGMDAMWSIFCEAENKQVVAICCDQLSEIYLNHERNGEESFRETYMRDLTEKCMAHLSQGYDEKRSSAIERSVQLLIMFFAKFEGEELERSFKLSLSQNQYQQYSANNPVVYTFYFSPEGTKHELKLSANLPYGLLRRRISQEFKIHSSNFRIFCRQSKQYIERYQDEETPSHSRFVFNIQVLPQSTAEPFHPKNFIYQNDKYFDLLFDLLSFNQASDCHNNVWELIMKLPQNDHIKQLIVEMDRPWREILDGSFHKKLYCLNIIHELLKSQPVPQNKWLHSFVERQGYSFLYELLSEVNMEVIESALSKKFISKLLTIICFFLLPTDPSIIFGANQIPTSAVLPSACLARIVECISRICDYSLLREQTDLENSQAEKLSYAIAQANYLRSQQMQTNPIPQTAAAALAEPRQPEFFLTERDIVHSCLIILKRIYSNSLDMVFMHPLFENILRKGLARIDNSVLQKFLLQILENMFASCSDKPEVSQTLLPLVLQRVLPDIVSQSLTKGEDFYLSERTTPFFRFASTIILKSSSIIGAASTTGATVFDFNQQGRLVAEMIIRRPIVETSQSHKDDVVIGLMTLLRDIIIVHPILRATLNQEYGLVKALLNFTFEFPTSSTSSAATANLAIEANNTSAAMISESQQVAVASSSIRGPKFKSAESKKHSYELLSVLSMNCLENVNQIMQYIKPLILSGEWRTKQFKNWEIEPKKNEKSSTGYVGIKNLGCICYMNSLLQQLYMIPSFRDTILRCKDPSYETTPAEDNVLYQLKCMYTALKLSEKEAYNPKMLCNSIKDYDGQPTNVFEQMDIDEFFNSLMDKLETAMKSTIHSDAIKNHFGGVLANQIISKGCAHSSEREEEFLSLCLQVKNKKDIKQSLEALIQGEILDGDNSYHCEKCDKKVAAVKRTCLKKLPNHLILVLKRFEFNYDSMQKVKLNQFCSFPEEIDFHEFSQQGLRKADELAKNAQNTADSAAAAATAPTPAANNATSVEQQSASRRSKNEGQSNDNPTNSSNNQQESSESTAQNSQPADKPENYFKYRLSGIVIHMGVADSGHYYSYIGDREAKDNNVRWMEFNDNIVKPFNPKDIPNEAFGGEEKWKQQFYMQDNAMNNFRQKIRNAYLLFYDRVEMFPPEGAAAAAASTATATSKETNASTSDNNNNTTDNTGMTTNATADFSIENQSANNSSKNDEELVLKKVKSKKQSQVIEDEEEEEEEGERENLVPDDKRMVSEEEEAAACAARKKINAERGEEQELEAKYLGEFKQDLVRQNHSFHLHKILFSAEFSSFMQSLIANYPVAENATPLTFPFTLDPPSITRQLTREYSDLEFIKFSITYFLTTAIRTKIAPELLENLYLCIKQQLSLSLAASQWLLSCFTDARLVREILMSPSLSARSYITVLLAIAAEKVYTTEKGKVLEQAIEEDVPPTTYIGQFINCLLGCLPNSYNYTDYFDLLLRLLRIGGEEITTYYLNVGLIGRLMEFLYELKSKKRNSNQSEYIILPYNVPPIPLLGLPAQEGQKKISDLMLKQDSSNFNNSANLVHFWALLEKLVYLCHLPSRNPARTPSSIHYELTKDEIHQIYKDSDAVMYFMLKSEEKSSVKQMNNILAYLSYENHLLTEYVHQVCASIVNDKQCHEFLYAFTCLKSFFRINDSISQKRIELSLNKVIQSIEANQKYQKETDVCQQFLLKILHDCPAAAVHLMKNHQNHIQLQIKLMQDYKPNKKEADENMQRSPRAELQYYDIKMPTNLQQLYNLRLWKLSQFVKLKMGTFQSLRPTFDTDDISHESQILPGKLFDYFDKQSMQWKNIRCYEVDQVRRIAKFYEIFPQLETRATNIKDEQEFYDKKGMLVYLFFSLGQHKLVPFQSMADEQSAILKPFTANGNYIEDKDESDKLTGEEAHIAQVTNASRTGGAALQDAGTNGSAEPTDGEMSSQGIIHGSAQGNDHDTDDANNPEADQYSSSNNMGELDANIDMGYQMSEEEEEEEEEDEDEDEEEEEDEDEDFNRDPTSNQTDNTDGQQQDNTAHTGGQQP